MWLPAWAGRIYARLWARLASGAFGIPDLCELAELKPPQARTAVSLLRRRGFLVVLGREGRRKRYRVLDPSTVLAVRGWGVANYEDLPGPYVPLLLAFLRGLLASYGSSLRSAVLYGSVARGHPSPESDLDLLLVAEDLANGYLERAARVGRVEGQEPVVAEKRRLREAGRRAELSWILMDPKEARRLRLLYLDVCQEGVLLLDREGFFEGVLDAVREAMQRAEARRHPAGEGWYWTFHPDFPVGAEVG